MSAGAIDIRSLDFLARPRWMLQAMVPAFAASTGAAGQGFYVWVYLAALPFIPQFAPDTTPRYDRFELVKEFLNPNPGQNFSFGLGMGIAILVEKTTDGPLDLPPIRRAALTIDDV